MNAAMGHNRPPPFDESVIAALRDQAAKALDAAGEWAAAGDLHSADQAERLNDFRAGLRKQRRTIDTARSDQKKPHDDAGKAVQAAFKPLLDMLDRALANSEPPLTAYLKREEARKRAAAEAERAAARRAQEEADRLAAQAAARNDIAGEVEAEAAREEAEKQAKAAERMAKEGARVESATGGARTSSLRTTRRAEIDNPFQVFAHYRKRPEVLDLLTRLATADIRAGKDVPGTNTIIEEKAA